MWGYFSHLTRSQQIGSCQLSSSTKSEAAFCDSCKLSPGHKVAANTYPDRSCITGHPCCKEDEESKCLGFPVLVVETWAREKVLRLGVGLGSTLT